MRSWRSVYQTVEHTSDNQENTQRNQQAKEIVDMIVIISAYKLIEVVHSNSYIEIKHESVVLYLEVQDTVVKR